MGKAPPRRISIPRRHVEVCDGGKATKASAPERAEKDLCVRVDKSVRQDLVLEQPQLLRGGQRAIDEQVGRLEVGRVLRELLDRVAAVSQDAGVAIDVRDLALDDGRVEEALVGHAESLGRLVLDTFPRFERGGNRLEGGRRDGVILDPVCVVLRLSLTLLFFTTAPPAAYRKAPMATYGILYVLPVRLSRTVRLSSAAALLSAGRPILDLEDLTE